MYVCMYVRVFVFDRMPSGSSVHSKTFGVGSPTHSASTLRSCVRVHSARHSLRQVVLDAGGSPDIPNGEGYSPLHLAIQENHPECVEMLLVHGADPLVLTRDGDGVCMVAAQSNSYESCVHVLQVAPPSLCSPSCPTVPPKGTSVSLVHSHESCVHVLQAGADPHAPSRSGLRPVDVARMEGFDRVAELLNTYTPTHSQEELRLQVRALLKYRLAILASYCLPTPHSTLHTPHSTLHTPL